MITIVYTIIGSVIGGLLLTGIIWLINKPRVSFSLKGDKPIALKPRYVEYGEDLFYILSLFECSEWHSFEKRRVLLNKKIKEYNNFQVQFVLDNKGRESLKHFKLEVKFNGAKVIDNNIIFGLSNVTNFVYSNQDDKPLLQNDPIYFCLTLKPDKDVNAITCHWTIKGDRFNKKGDIKINVEPKKIITLPNVIPVYKKEELPDGAKVINDLNSIIEDMTQHLKQ